MVQGLPFSSSSYLINSVSTSTIHRCVHNSPTAISILNQSNEIHNIICCSLANSTHQSNFWEANNSSASQDIRRILWNPKVHYHLNNSPPYVLILSKMNPAYAFPLYFFKIHFNIIYPSAPTSLGFPIKYAVALPLFPAKCHMPQPSHSRCFVGSKKWSSSLCNFLHPTVTSFLSDTNILLSILFSNTLDRCSSLDVRDQVQHPQYKIISTIIVLYILVFSWQLDDKNFVPESNNNYPNLICSLFLRACNFGFGNIDPWR